MSIFEPLTQCGCNDRNCYFCWLRNRIYATTPHRLDINDMPLKDILAAVAVTSGVKIADIVGASRKAEVCVARHVFCYIARQQGRWSYKMIGDIINRNYATVMCSVKKVTEMKRDKQFASLLGKLSNKMLIT